MLKNRLKRNSILLIFIFISGCGPGLHTLMELDREQKSHQKYISSQEAKFKVLLRDINENKLKLGLSKNEAIKLYGEPVIIKEEDENVIFLYRQPLDFIPSQKIYLIFDQDGILVDYKLIYQN